MLKVSEAWEGMQVFIDDKGISQRGKILVIDHENHEFGVMLTDTRTTKLYPEAKVRARFLCSNEQPKIPAQSTKEKELLRLFGGYIITLAEGKSSPEIAREVAGEIRRAGIAQVGTRAQDLIAIMR